ncbi:hypothetical protein RM705_33665, partial [Streptomyces sp. DSM 41636]|nr:hypothetical protein [Streptomyces sp. DSM 41636]
PPPPPPPPAPKPSATPKPRPSVTPVHYPRYRAAPVRHPSGGATKPLTFVLLITMPAVVAIAALRPR